MNQNMESLRSENREMATAYPTDDFKGRKAHKSREDFKGLKGLKYLTNQELDDQLGLQISREREILSTILLHIQEVDRRKMYLDFQYPNLFMYLTKHKGYSNASAQRRIDAARLGTEVSGVVESIDKGEVNLSQLHLLQRSIRQSDRESGYQVPKEMKAEIFENLKHQSLEDSQVIVAKALDIQIKVPPKVIHQADESVRFEVTLNKNQWEKLNEMRDLLSNSLPMGSWDQVLEYVADKVIKNKTGKGKVADLEKSQATKQTKSQEVVGVITPEQGTSKSPSLYSLKKFVSTRDRCCQSQDSKTGRICGSKWRLNVDHIHPKWAGGSDTLENLQVLCAQHNLAKYDIEKGVRKRS